MICARGSGFMRKPFTNGSIQIDGKFRPCEVYGHCNPCDIKVKTNRFQVFGHTSVEIRGIED